ncbi:MAG: winged helix-turn-helix transcriptional regulator [Candidatus Liptonbacteria bacterium]|nr:winged helix-turn-helix transcriptional regulator [Candidatus Liptonbacteria bacterium]
MTVAKISAKIPAKVFKAVSSECGFKIFYILSLKKELCVSDIADEVGLSMPAISHQLHKMEGAGLVISKRMGRTICYRLKINRLTTDLMKCFRYLLSQK